MPQITGTPRQTTCEWLCVSALPSPTSPAVPHAERRTSGSVYAAGAIAHALVPVDGQAAFQEAAGRTTPDFINFGGSNIGGLTLVPGLYKYTNSIQASSDFTLAGGCVLHELLCVASQSADRRTSAAVQAA